MKITNKLNASIIIIAALFIIIGCSSADQQGEANKVVDTANKKLDDAKDLYSKTETRNTALFNVNIQTIPQFIYYKTKVAGEAKSIVADYEKVSEMLKDVSKQYDDISRMNVNEKYKEYAKIKSNEFATRAEAVAVRKGNAQGLAEIDDYRILMQKFKENNDKSDKLFKDAEDTAAKAKKIEEENKEIFKA